MRSESTTLQDARHRHTHNTTNTTRNTEPREAAGYAFEETTWCGAKQHVADWRAWPPRTCAERARDSTHAAGTTECMSERERERERELEYAGARERESGCTAETASELTIDSRERGREREREIESTGLSIERERERERACTTTGCYNIAESDRRVLRLSTGGDFSVVPAPEIGETRERPAVIV